LKVEERSIFFLKRTGRRAACYIKKRRVPRQAKYKHEKKQHPQRVKGEKIYTGVPIKTVDGGDSRNRPGALLLP
jgi:hypothetical protein